MNARFTLILFQVLCGYTKFLAPKSTHSSDYSSPWIHLVSSNTSKHLTEEKGKHMSVKSTGPRFMIKLYDYLFKDYRIEIRPVADDSEPIAVVVKFWLKQILKVNERDQTLNVYCWLEMYWIDEFLKWDPSEFGGLDLIHVPSSKIWRPDILVYNNANMNVEDSELETNAIIKYTGEVTLFRAMITDITCTLSLLLFPFDQQVCYLTLASWSMDGSKLLISPLNISTSLELYVRNTEWDLVDFSAKMYEKIYDCCPHPFPDLTFFIALKRSPSYYIFSLIIPSAFITVVTIVGFFTPHSTTGENHEKVSTAVTALLSMTIIMMMISDEVPATSEVMPLIGKYYIGLIFIIFIAAFTTTITLALQMRGNAGARMSASMRQFLFERVAKSWIGSWLFTVQITDRNAVRKIYIRRRKRQTENESGCVTRTPNNGERFANSVAEFEGRFTSGRPTGERRKDRPDHIDLGCKSRQKNKQSKFRGNGVSAATISPPLHSPLINFQKAISEANAAITHNSFNDLYGSGNLDANYSGSYDRFDTSASHCGKRVQNHDVVTPNMIPSSKYRMTGSFPRGDDSPIKNLNTNFTRCNELDMSLRIRKGVEVIEDYITEMHEQRYIEFEWEQGARIIERLVMIFYIILTMAFAFFMLGNTGDDVVLTDDLMDRIKR